VTVTIPELETWANESLRDLGKTFITALRDANVKGALVRDVETGLPIKVHPTIKDMFPSGKNPYYNGATLAKKSWAS